MTSFTVMSMESTGYHFVLEMLVSGVRSIAGSQPRHGDRNSMRTSKASTLINCMCPFWLWLWVYLGHILSPDK